MSLAIDIDRVTQVLLADGWHKVDFKEDASTFDIDAYEFIEKSEGRETTLHGGGQSGVCSTGATWQEKGASFFCPLTAILAVRYDTTKKVTPGVPIGFGSTKPSP